MTIELSPRWLRAVDNVVGCALAFRAKAMLSGSPQSDLEGEDFVRDLITTSAQIAREAHSKIGEEKAPCDCGRCEEVSIIVSASVRMAVITGQPQGEIVDQAIKTFNEYMKGRS